MTTSTIEMPFEIGTTYWLPSTSPRQTTEPCPVCQGSKVVTVCTVAENFTVDCNACGHGYEGPRGYVTEYHYDPHVTAFTIAGVVGLDAEGWTVRREGGWPVRFNQLRTTEAEALEVSKAVYLAQEEHNMRARGQRRKGVSKATWTVRYHNDQIKKLERELAYHRGKVGKDV